MGKSPAKLLRSTKRITIFLRNKWKTDSSNDSHIQQVQITTVPLSCHPTTNTRDQTLPLPLEVENFKLIIKQYDSERQKEREKLKIERRKEREKDHEQFKLELEKLMLDIALPP